MTQLSHAFVPSNFDTGPLSWVIGEIREALGRSAKALQDAAERSADAQPTLLLHAKSHLHQAHGALQMVDVAGVLRLSEAAEQVIDRFKDGTLALDAERARAVDETYRALVEYLEELLKGAAPQPVRLFPYYRTLQELLGVERVHPGQMLALDLAPALLPGGSAGPAPDYAVSRAAFEKALLAFLRSLEPDAQRAQAAAMRDALAPIVGGQPQAEAHAFWLALQAVADLVAGGQVAPDLYVKQLFGQINLQLRRQVQGDAQLPEALLRDALFFIAAAPEPTPDARVLRDAYRVAGQVPSDYLERRYGRVDPEALKDARAALQETKQGWDRVAAEGDAPAGDFNDALSKLAGASEKLGAPALAHLLRELGQAASESMAAGRNDQFSLEMAEAMLFVEHGLDQLRQLPEDFGQHAEAVGQRLLALAHGETPPDAPAWHGEMARELQEGQTVAVLAGEIRTGLRQVEKLIDEYHENPARAASLEQVDPLLHQLQGALAILDQEQASAAVSHVRAQVRGLVAHAPDDATRVAVLDNLALNVGALGFFTDALAQNVDGARQRFRFDAASALFRELPYDAQGEAAAAPVAAEPQPVAPAAPDPAPASAPAPVPAPAPAPVPEEDAIEAELLEIFIGEGREVLDVVQAELPAAQANPADQATLTRLRRAFHTLKGSSRMVGLELFATGAAAVEKVMNLWLAEERAATPDLLALLALAHAELSAWVDDLAAGGSARDSEALVAAAARVQAGEPLGGPDVATASAPADAAAVSVPEADVDAVAAPAALEASVDAEPAVHADADVPEPIVSAPFVPTPDAPAELVPETVGALDAEAAAGLAQDTGDTAAEVPAEPFEPAADFDVAPEDAPAPLPALSPDELPDNVLTFPVSESNVRHVGDLEIPLPLYNIYLGETEELVRTLAEDFANWRTEPMRPLSAQALKAAHTLGGTSATVGFRALRELAVALEEALQVAVPPLNTVQFDLLDETVERVRVMLQVFALGELAPAQPELLARLEALRDELGRIRADAVFDDADAELAERLDALFAATYDSILADPPLTTGTPVLPASTELAPRAPLPRQDDPAVNAVDDLFDSFFDDPFEAPTLEQAQPAPAPAPAAAPAEAPADGVIDIDALFDLPTADPASAPCEPAMVEVVDAAAEPVEPAEVIDFDALMTDAAPVAEPQAEVQPFGEAEVEPLLELQPEAEAQPELHAEAQPFGKAEIEALPELQPEAEAQPEPQAEAQPFGEAEIEPLTELQPDAEAQPEPQTEAQPFGEAEIEPLLELQPDAEAQPEPQAEVQPFGEAEIEPLPELQLDAEAQPEPQPEAQPFGEAETDALLELQPEAEAQPELQAEAQPFGEAEIEALPELRPEAEAQPELQAEMQSFGEAEIEPLAESLAESQPEAEAQSELQAETQPFAEAELEPLSEPQPEPEPQPVADTVLTAEPVFVDELDADLLPVFMEEAADLLPQIGNGLRQWQQNPADAATAQGLLRALHTVKGSARMAGAMRLGQHTHALETQIENMLHAGTTNPAAFDELLANYDQAQLLFEQLQHPAAPAPAGTEPATVPAAAAAAAPVALPAAPADDQAARAPLVRVRADILDRLVNQAGEVSITRSKLETQVDTLKTMLTDFTDNLAALRRQLREVEMQAESQIASRLSVAGEREFDPLEFDRFTRLQELTRMMAESVNDVGSFQEGLARTVDAASEDLTVQSRLTRELQRDLMRARMVPFASLSERLFRVARQTAKETDKRVNLDIRGGGVEIDRSVLERMAAPFEHLLRNAIVHGIEARTQRAAAGKAETGELLVQVSQQGNEVEIRFADDGAGLDLPRIRAKAAASGLLAEGEDVSDEDAAELVFEPGFSTADTLTELAGRGVGMDVVRSEARALGGRVDIETKAGRGAAFAIHLPLTLASTQVVLVASGARTHALPAVLVEQVLQVREADLDAAFAAGAIEMQGERVPLHYLPSLLNEPGGAGSSRGQRSYPVLILRSGTARLALQVDEVQGNREVVIKNIGPQLARMPGIAGATVLGSGEIVLILDPVQMAQIARPARGAAAQAEPAPAPAPRVATVMVVDDSITVRKVTQRLLEREDYHVLLAKDGVDALEQLQATRPDLILADIEMPRMDGFDLTRHVRGDAATASLPIIMITSRTADKHRNFALGLGVDAYFGKPFQEEALLAAIEGLLESGRQA